jgi:hypothetical protein
LILFIGVFIAWRGLFSLLSYLPFDIFAGYGSYILFRYPIGIPLILGILAFWHLSKDVYRANPVKLVASAIVSEALFQLWWRLTYYISDLNAQSILAYWEQGLGRSSAKEAAGLVIDIGAEVTAALLVMCPFGFALFFSGKGRPVGKLVSTKAVLAVTGLALLSGLMTFLRVTLLYSDLHRQLRGVLYGLLAPIRLGILVLAMYFVVLWADKRFKGKPRKTAQQPSPPTDEAE